MKESLQHLFANKEQIKLSKYLSAGFPKLNDTAPIIKALSNAGVDFIEVGIPYSDPLADGPTIQHSGQIALDNGISLKKIFEQINTIKNEITSPLILMGYYNTILQFGVESFLQECETCHIAAAIIPDLPMEVYLDQYQSLFNKYSIAFIPLITPETTKECILFLDQHTNGFLYIVATHGTTGGAWDIKDQALYFERIKSLNLKNPTVVGFGIHNAEQLKCLNKYVDGAIIGSAFIRHLTAYPDLSQISNYIQSLKQ